MREGGSEGGRVSPFYCGGVQNAAKAQKHNQLQELNISNRNEQNHGLVVASGFDRHLSL